MAGKTRAPEFYDNAMRCLRENDVRGAMTNLTLSLGCEERAQTYLERAKLYVAQNDHEKASKDVERGLALLADGGQPPVLQWIGKLFGQSTNTLDHLQGLKTELDDKLKQEKRRREKILARHDPEEMLELFQLSGHKKKIMKAVQPSFRLDCQDDDADTSPSKIGGTPLVADNFEWPLTAKEQPLAFLLQLDLTSLEGKSSLPSHGLLSFFYDATELDEPPDSQSWRVFYFVDATALKRASLPEDLPNRCRFAARAVTCVQESSFPDDEYMSLGDDYQEFLSAWYGRDKRHQLLGHPQLIQGDYRDYCLRTHKNETAKEIKKDDWQLLLQLDSDHGMQWGDDGRLYFCIDKTALAKGDFSKVWVVFQNY